MLGICLIVLYVVFLSLPAGIYTYIKAPLSLRYSMSGVVGAAAMALWMFSRLWGADEIPDWEVRVLVGMGLFSPLWFSIGARRSLREEGSHRAKALRWLNVAGFGVSVGLIAVHLMGYAWLTLYEFLIPQTAAAVVVLAFSRVVLWQPRTRFRWAGFLPGYPAILLIPAVPVVWAMICAVPWLSYEPELPCWLVEVGMTSPRVPRLGLPLPFYGVWWGPDFPYYEFRLIPYLVDLLLAVVVAWVLALAVDRLVLRWVRPRSGGIRSPAGGERCGA